MISALEFTALQLLKCVTQAVEGEFLATRGSISDFAAVILAAGMSRRMGQPKMLLPLDGGTLLQQIVRTYLEILRPSQIIVVTGFESERISASIAALNVLIHHNPEFEAGMLSSVKLGILGAKAICQHCFLALGDQPFISAATLRSLAASHLEAGADLSQPVYQGKRGHPLVISSDSFDEIQSLPENATLKTFVDSHPVNAVETDDAFVLNDVDTPSDYQRLLQIRSETCSLVETS